MHDLSETKLTRLHQAREAYDAAAISLPSKQGVLWRQSWSTDAGSVRSGISENSEDMWYGSPTKNRWIERFAISLPYSDRNQRSSARTSNRALKPSPLRIHKHLVRGSLTVTPPRSRPPENEANHGFRQSQIPPLSAKPTDDTNPSTPPRPASPLSVTLLSSTTISPHGQTRLRFDRLLVEFADMLRGHKDAVERLILGVQDSQTSRHVKRLASFSADKEARAADLQRRIVKLRAIGWERERFRPERYQDLCETALAEL
ncbi:MAG: hypothetical protein LQ352_005244 [Teloschistes flavicans]|nr:MAG: hypothetical protein LQ352_005244 [Teloschistes flavicans]